MNPYRPRSGWVRTSGVLCSIALLALAGCASVATAPAANAASAGLATSLSSSEDDDWSQLKAQMRIDLNRCNSRETARTLLTTPSVASTQSRDREFGVRAQAMFAPLSKMSLRQPVVGVRASMLDDSWHAPRDGGARVHKGIDIFATKGTEIVAVVDGVISFIGDQKLGGHCIWLTTENGASFYYAHLDRWAAGLYEGMEVQAGDLVGYVGNTGNAKNTPSHLHFGINQNDEMVNPYPLLTRAVPTLHAHIHTTLSGGPVATR